MPVRNIEKIKVGDYPEGQFAGGYIYSLQISQGYAENVNELTLDIVYDTNTPINLPAKNLTNSYRIKIGDLIIPSMYFMEHSKEISATENILRCKFIDNSFLLDKYYVGLSNRHHEVERGTASFGLSVYCTDCEQNLTATPGVVQRSAVINSPNLVLNNLLIVGEEEFTEQACDIPDVKYNFTDLLNTLNKLNVISFSGLSDIAPRYKTSYMGTLREVLSNWCSDFGFTFYWDFLQNKLIGLDLRSPINLAPVESFINENFNQNSTLPILSYNQEESLVGTYQQDNIDYILKPTRSKSREFKDHWMIDYLPVTIQDAFFLLGSSIPDTISCVLAKYNSQARTLYNLQIGRYSNVGFNVKYIGIETYLLRTCLKNIYDFAYSDGAGVAIRLGTYDEGVHDASNQKESTIAEGIGRYYKNLKWIKFNAPTCTDTNKMSYSAEYYPQPMTSVPFAEVGGNPTRPYPVGWWIERNPAYSDSSNLDVSNLGPIYMNIDGETADQIMDTILLYNPSDTNPDRYRNLTLVAWKPYLYTNWNYNVWNSAEEDYVQAQFEESSQARDCETLCNQDLTSEICANVGCKKITTPAHGLVSKFSKALWVKNALNGTSSYTILPAEQPYNGYAKADGTFEWTEGSIKEMRANSNFSVDKNVLEYSINLNDITTDEPSAGTIVGSNQKQSSLSLDVKQTQPKKKLSLKIIGATYGSLATYLNPTHGLVGYNIYINDQGIFTDLTFENRPAKKPKQEVVMQKVGPQKIRVTK